MTPGHDRRQNDEDWSELKALILGLDHKIEMHIAKEEETVQALKELVIIWRGSKIIIPFLATVAVSAWAIYEWAKDHLK